MKRKLGNCIDFTNDILKNEKKLKFKPRVYYILRKYKKKGYCDILIDIIENSTQFQLIDSLVNVNHAISVVG